jgi:hypothetical protein
MVGHEALVGAPIRRAERNRKEKMRRAEMVRLGKKARQGRALLPLFIPESSFVTEASHPPSLREVKMTRLGNHGGIDDRPIGKTWRSDRLLVGEIVETPVPEGHDFARAG